MLGIGVTVVVFQDMRLQTRNDVIIDFVLSATDLADEVMMGLCAHIFKIPLVFSNIDRTHQPHTLQPLQGAVHRRKVDGRLLLHRGVNGTRRKMRRLPRDDLKDGLALCGKTEALRAQQVNVFWMLHMTLVANTCKKGV
jgi:hypothetical protein